MSGLEVEAIEELKPQFTDIKTVKIEKIDTDLYRYTITIGNLKKLDYVQHIGTVRMKEDSCYTNGQTYTFYRNGSMEVSDSFNGKNTLYDINNNII